MIARLRRFLPLLRAGLAIGLSAGALLLALRQVSPAALHQAFTQADVSWVLLALASVAANTFCKALRWQVLCAAPGGAIPFGRYLGALLAGQALNLLYPARLGDLLRAQAIGEQGPGAAFVLGTLVAEKTLDLLAYGLLLASALVLVPQPAWLGVSLSALALAALVLAAIFAVIVLRADRLFAFLPRLGASRPERFSRWLATHLQRGLAGLAVLRHGHTLPALLGLTALAWGTAVLNNQLVFHALGLHLPPLAALLLLVALQAGISLPALPGSMGVFEYTCVLVLALWQVGPETAFAYGVLLHALVMLPGVLLGLVYLWRWGWLSRSVR
ncbi:MAG: lysylphosphatidylglycerol synthase transmembrane domain-containing protein [Chloroflexota bacterium]